MKSVGFRINTSAPIICALLGLFVFPNIAFALVTFNGSNGVDATILTGGGCSGCHGTTPTASACTGTAVQTAWLDIDTAAQRRTSVSNCYSNINEKINPSPSFGVQMPQGGPFFSAGELSMFSQWNTNGRLLEAAPTVTTNAASSITNSSATLNSATAANGATTTVNYRYALNSGLTSSTTTASSGIGSGGGTGTSSAARSISGLLCGTTYHYRAQGTNSVGTTNGSILNFISSACSDPVIVFSGQGSSSGNRISVAKDLSFNQGSLTISASDVDTGSISWSFGTPSSGTISGVNSSTGAFTYNAPASAGNASFVITVTDTDPVGGGGPNTDSVIVFVTIADNAPQFRSASSPGGVVIASASLTVSEGDGSAPSQSINLFAEDSDLADTITWSIANSPSRGTLSALNNATGITNSISYTPNNNVDINDSFTIRVTDGTTNVDLPVTAMVTPVPDNPVASDDGPVVFDIGVDVTVSVLSNDSDVDTGDVITVDPASIATTGGNTAVAISGNTQIQYRSTATQFTSNTFQYSVIDDSPGTLSSNLATVTMTPRDSDGDGIINYLDNCAATANPLQTDTDNDSGGYVMMNNLSDPADPNTGGDACDLDDDGDTIPDSYELANMMDPLDPSDAAADNDGDGISNLDEYNDGTNPNLANLMIDATGYLTPYSLETPSATTIHPQATSVRASDYGPYRPGRNTIIWTGANASNDSLAPTSEQTLDIRPLVSFSANQQVEEGSAVTVRVNLNGDPVAYPVTVNYSVSGTANNPADHDAASGVVRFDTPSTSETIPFTVANDAIADPNETVVFTLNSASNAALGTKRTHRVIIVEGNVAPRASLQFTQSTDIVTSTYAGDGVINIGAIVTDVNSAQSHSYDWSGSDAALMPPVGGATWAVDPATLTLTGNYLVDVVVTDNGSPVAATHISRILKVIAGSAPVLAAVDSDGDGLNDDDPLEGYGDDDGDGIPNYLDALSGANESNLFPDQTVSAASSFLVETENGLKLGTGNTSQAAGSYGSLLTDADIALYGSSIGAAPVNGDDNFRHVGGIYNFEVSGMEAGSSARVVIPLQSSIPRNASYRKFNPATGWSGFVVDANNRVASARGARGACPVPGSSLYAAGLRYLDNCVELLILDGGPNDSDNSVNGVISDPGAVGVRLTSPQQPVVEEGAGRLSLHILLFLLLLGGITAYLRAGRARAKAKA